MKPEPEESDKISVSVTKPAAPASNQPSQKGRVFDVMRPGKAMSSPTSRPVISSHSPTVQNTLSGMTGIGDAKPLLDPKRRSITPVEHEEDPQTAPPVVPAAEQPKPAETAPVPVQHNDPLPEGEPAKANAEPTTAPDLTDQQVDAADTPKESAPIAAANPETEAPAEAVPTRTAPEAPVQHRSTLAEEIDPLEDLAAPDGNPVVVSHHSSGVSLVKLALTIVIIIVLAVVAFDVMLDSGIVSVQGIPHTHLLPQ